MNKYRYFVLELAASADDRDALQLLDTLLMLRPVAKVCAVADSWGDGVDSAADLVENGLGLRESSSHEGPE